MSMIEALLQEQGKERARLAAIDELEIWQTAPEQEFDDLTELAAVICGTPVSLISLVGREEQYFKSARNFNRTGTPREQSFCERATQQESMVIVPNALADERFASNPLVTGEPNIRFYAGAPISGGGHVLGSLCVIGTEPHQLTPMQQRGLEGLARQTSSLLEARLTALRYKRLQVKAETKREQWQQAIDSARIAAWFYDPARNVVGGDERTSRLFGLTIPEGPAEMRRFLFDKGSSRNWARSLDIEAHSSQAQGPLAFPHTHGAEPWNCF